MMKLEIVPGVFGNWTSCVLKIFVGSAQGELENACRKKDQMCDVIGT